MQLAGPNLERYVVNGGEPAEVFAQAADF